MQVKLVVKVVVVEVEEEEVEEEEDNDSAVIKSIIPYVVTSNKSSGDQLLTSGFQLEGLLL